MDARRATARFLMVSGAAAWVVLLGGLGYASLVVGRGFSTREPPSRLEATLAGKLRHWSIPRSERERKNPAPSTPEVLARGRAHFADHCALCHANDGSGKTDMGEAMYPRAPDMRSDGTQQLSDGELFWIIENGVRLTGMPGWHADGEEQESWELVTFIRHLPKLTAAEVQEMEKLNPQSPEEE